MDRLRIYFEDIHDCEDQSKFLSQFGTPDTQDGICFNLVLKWLQLYCANGQQIAPNIVFRELIKQPDSIRSIAEAQSAYQKEQIAHRDDTFVIRYGLGGNMDKDEFFSPYDFAQVVNHFIQDQNYNMVEITLIFDDKSKHAIGIIIHNGRIYLYDPNVGVMSSDLNNMKELLEKVPIIYGTIFPHMQLAKGIITNIDYQL